MEDILEVYQRGYDPRFPVVCFDERPYQLLQGLAQELPMRAGRAATPRKVGALSPSPFSSAS